MLLCLSLNALQQILQMHEDRPVPTVGARRSTASAGLAICDYDLAAQRAAMRRLH